jgi:hypothetical protein
MRRSRPAGVKIGHVSRSCRDNGADAIIAALRPLAERDGWAGKAGRCRTG